MTTAPAALLAAMTARVAAHIREVYAPDAPGRVTSVEQIAAEYAQAAWDGLVDVSEVREEWNLREPVGGEVFGYYAGEHDHDDVLAEEPDLVKVRRLVITTQPEPAPTEEQP